MQWRSATTSSIRSSTSSFQYRSTRQPGFHDQPGLWAQEIDDVTSQRDLAAKAEAFEVPTGGSYCDAIFPAAHTASFSRPILALCRMSTGNFGCSRKRSMRD